MGPRRRLLRILQEEQGRRRKGDVCVLRRRRLHVPLAQLLGRKSRGRQPVRAARGAAARSDRRARLRADGAGRLQDEIAFMKSCRGAVKANQRLELAEMRRLLADMSTIENPWACVHGRPTVLKMDISQLDDHFGRLG